MKLDLKKNHHLFCYKTCGKSILDFLIKFHGVQSGLFALLLVRFFYEKICYTFPEEINKMVTYRLKMLMLQKIAKTSHVLAQSRLTPAHAWKVLQACPPISYKLSQNRISLKVVLKF